jgi:hypothetical protein
LEDSDESLSNYDKFDDVFDCNDESYSSTGVTFIDDLQNSVNIALTIQKDRKVVRMFRKSSLKSWKRKTW